MNSIRLFSALIFFLLCSHIIASEYHIDPIAGDDSNSGSMSDPWKTPQNIVTRYDSQRPSGWIQLQAGDTIFLHSGIHSFSYDYPGIGGINGFAFRQQHGEPGSPITLAAYPGEHPVINGNSSAIGLHILQSNHWVVDGIEFTNCQGAGLMVEECKGIEIRNCHVHHNSGVVSNNPSGIKLLAAEEVEIRHCIINDNYDRVDAEDGFLGENNRQIVIFRGGNIEIHDCYLHVSDEVQVSGYGNGIGYKHASDVTDATFEVHDNIFVQCSVDTGTARSHVHHNLFVDSYGILIRDLGGPTEILDGLYEFNTIISPGSGLYFKPAAKRDGIINGSGPVSFIRNLVITNDAENQCPIDIGRYENDALYNEVVIGDNLEIDFNGYHHTQRPDNEAQFCLFERNDGNPENFGILGDRYSFDDWKLLGYDTHTQIGDPKLDEHYFPTAESFQDKGRFATTDAFTIWQYQNFSFAELTKEVVSSPSADPDHDGITNLDEFRLGKSPLISDLPTTFLSPTGIFHWETIQGVRYQVQTSIDLSEWIDLNQPILGNGADAMISVDFTGHMAKFFRIQILPRTP